MIRSFVVALCLVGCSSSSEKPAGGPDPNKNYAPATINAIDLDPGNGPFANGADVRLDRVVAVTAVDKYVNKVNQECRYEVWVEDPGCTTAPCGMVIKAIGPKAPTPTSTGKDCPKHTESGTLLATVHRGDTLTVSGHVIVEMDATPPSTVFEHQLFVDSIAPSPQAATVKALVLSDPAVFGQFAAHLGTTWNQYEGMLVTLAPAGSTLQIASIVDGGFQTTPGNTYWGNTFDSKYVPAGVTAFPTMGTAYRAISGVVSTRHGGSIMPVGSEDFVP